MTVIVGLTGGIGSGKTAAANYFAECGAPIIDADLIAREVVQVGTPAYQAIIQQFGKEVLQSDGKLNRTLLRQIIFADPDQKRWLEALLHPLIYQVIQQRISEVNYPYCIVIIPLLSEQLPLFGNLINYIVVIEAPLKMRLERIMERDHCDYGSAHAIIQQQATPDERRQIAQCVILNDGSLVTLKEKIQKLHQNLLKGISPTHL